MKRKRRILTRWSSKIFSNKSIWQSKNTMIRSATRLIKEDKKWMIKKNTLRFKDSKKFLKQHQSNRWFETRKKKLRRKEGTWRLRSGQWQDSNSNRKSCEKTKWEWLMSSWLAEWSKRSLSLSKGFKTPSWDKSKLMNNLKMLWLVMKVHLRKWKVWTQDLIALQRKED